MANYASAYILATSVVIAIGGFAEFAEYSEMNKYVHTTYRFKLLAVSVRDHETYTFIVKVYTWNVASFSL